MTCICQWPSHCDGSGWVTCFSRHEDCYCQCGCKEECYGCVNCDEGDFGDDDLDRPIPPASGEGKAEG